MKRLVFGATCALALGATPAAAQGYGEAYKAYQDAVQRGDADGMRRAALEAWQRAEAAEVAPGTLAILAQNAAFLSLVNAPDDAVVPARRALRLGEEGHGTAEFSIDELRVMAAAAEALARPSGRNRSTVIDALNEYWRLGGAAEGVAVTAGLATAKASLDKGAWNDALAIARPLGEALSRAKPVRTDLLGSANVLAAVAVLSASDVFEFTGPIYQSRGTPGRTFGEVGLKSSSEAALTTAWHLLDVADGFFAAQASTEAFDPTLGKLLAWKAVTRGYAMSGGFEIDKEVDIGWRGDRAPGRAAPFASPCGAQEERSIPVKRVDPVFPVRALRRVHGGAVLVGYAVDQEGAVISPRILGSVPTDVFDDNVLAAVAQWQFDASGASEACRRNQITTVTFNIGR